MANASILAAFERMWLHVTNALGSKADTFHTHDEYMKSTNPIGTGYFSMNRKSGTTIGNYSVAEGYNTTASSDNSHAEGFMTVASALHAHAEGSATTASGFASHAEGVGTTASYQSTHAEGYNTTASGYAAHAEGEATEATASYSHAEGYQSAAIGTYSHAEGYQTVASGIGSHAEGYRAFAIGEGYGHAEGREITASGNQHAQGHYNNISTATTGVSSGNGSTTAFVIGNGTSTSRSNAFRVTYDGKIYATSSITSSGRDYAEYFEWQDLNVDAEDRRGYFVTLDGDKIKIAKSNDYILGIVSGQPSVIGNSDEDWRGRYILDDFGAFITEEFEYEDIEYNEETGEMETVIKTGVKYKENPDYDSSLQYIQREDRPEWDAVGMLGVLSVRDDGTCEVNGYCKVTDDGIATASESGYRVIKRINNNVVEVIFR